MGSTWRLFFQRVGVANLLAIESKDGDFYCPEFDHLIKTNGRHDKDEVKRLQTLVVQLNDCWDDYKQFLFKTGTGTISFSPIFFFFCFFF